MEDKFMCEAKKNALKKRLSEQRMLFTEAELELIIWKEFTDNTSTLDEKLVDEAMRRLALLRETSVEDLRIQLMNRILGDIFKA